MGHATSFSYNFWKGLSNAYEAPILAFPYCILKCEMCKTLENIWGFISISILQTIVHVRKQITTNPFYYTYFQENFQLSKNHPILIKFDSPNLTSKVLMHP